MTIHSALIVAMRQRPLFFNGIAGGLLCASSDGVAQYLEKRQQLQAGTGSDGGENTKSVGACKSDNTCTDCLAQVGVKATPSSLVLSEVDWTRLGAAGMIGSIISGLIYPLAYAKLDALWVGTKFLTVLKKSLAEIATVGIVVNSLSMVSRGLLIADKNPSEVVQHVANELPRVTCNDFLVWMPYNMLAFSFVPPFIRPTTTAFMEASWQTYISLRSHDYSGD